MAMADTKDDLWTQLTRADKQRARRDGAYDAAVDELRHLREI
jgi:hypothetical protein